MSAATFLNAVEKAIGKLYTGDSGVFGSSFFFEDEDYGSLEFSHRENDHSLRVEIESYTGSKEKYYFDFGPEVKDSSTDALKNNGYFQLELESDCLNKVLSIINGEDFPEGIMITIDLPDDSLSLLHQLAQENNLTLDKMVEQLLVKNIDN